MIPDFEDNGYLPPGIHPATLEEVPEEAGLPFLHISLVEQEDFDEIVRDVYATDRHGIAKGMIEVLL
jgi:hypothetical protein